MQQWWLSVYKAGLLKLWTQKRSSGWEHSTIIKKESMQLNMLRMIFIQEVMILCWDISMWQQARLCIPMEMLMLTTLKVSKFWRITIFFRLGMMDLWSFSILECIKRLNLNFIMRNSLNLLIFFLQDLLLQQQEVIKYPCGIWELEKNYFRLEIIKKLFQGLRL